MRIPDLITGVTAKLPGDLAKRGPERRVVRVNMPAECAECGLWQADCRCKGGFIAKKTAHAQKRPQPSLWRTWTLRVDGWAPCTLNACQGHWSKRSRLKKGDRETIAAYLPSNPIQPQTSRRRVSLLIVWPPKKRRPDPDAFTKSLNDALVHNGILFNDSPDWVENAPVEQCRGDRLVTFITVEDL